MKPVEYTEAIASAICERVAMGEPVSRICEEEGMPSVSTFRRWRIAVPSLEQAYNAAREAQADMIFEELLDIVDDSRNDFIERNARGGGTYLALDKEAVMRSRLRFEARRFMIEKLNPKRYAVKTELDVKSSDGSMSPVVMSDEAKVTRLNAIYQAAVKRLEAKRSSKPQDPLDGSDLV